VYCREQNSGFHQEPGERAFISTPQEGRKRLTDSAIAALFYGCRATAPTSRCDSLPIRASTVMHAITLKVKQELATRAKSKKNAPAAAKSTKKTAA